MRITNMDFSQFRDVIEISHYVKVSMMHSLLSFLDCCRGSTGTGCSMSVNPWVEISFSQSPSVAGMKRGIQKFSSESSADAARKLLTSRKLRQRRLGIA